MGQWCLSEYSHLKEQLKIWVDFKIEVLPESLWVDGKYVNNC